MNYSINRCLTLHADDYATLPPPCAIIVNLMHEKNEELT